MPLRQLHGCAQPGCGRATRDRFCAEHSHGNAQHEADRARHAARRQRGLIQLYKAALWRHRIRPLVLRRDPLCKIGVLCGGHAPSTEVDHKTPAEIWIEQHGGDEASFYDLDNLQGACKADHARKTATEDRAAQRARAS